MKIREVGAREILDSRGNPTIEAWVRTDTVMGKGVAPSGASTGSHEALELRDGGKRYHGKGVLKAVRRVRQVNRALRGLPVTDQEGIDRALLRADGTRNKKRLGANLTVAVSMAAARAGAAATEQDLYEYLNPKSRTLPIPLLNIINGGMHAGNSLAIQEFMIVPVKARRFSEAIRMASEVYHTLREILMKRYGRGAINVGDEGGFAPPLRTTREALNLLERAIEREGYSDSFMLALDAAATSFYRNGKYRIDGRALGSERLKEYYLDIIDDYNIMSIEDPFHEEDFRSFAELNAETDAMIVGDDLTVTNLKRLQMAIEMNAIDTLLLKVNQIGTLTEAKAAHDLAVSNGLGVIVSHRSGETCDTFIADLSVALENGFIKAGAPCRGERVAKYNRLLEIEYLLGRRARYGRMR